MRGFWSAADDVTVAAFDASDDVTDLMRSDAWKLPIGDVGARHTRAPRDPRSAPAR